jgi:hypothetical protein
VVIRFSAWIGVGMFGLFKRSKNFTDYLNDVSMGRSSSLNTLLNIWSIDYNEKMVDSYNKGFESGVKDASEKLERAYEKVITEMHRVNDHKVEHKFIDSLQVQEVSVGKIISPLTGKVTTVTKNLKEFGIEVRCYPPKGSEIREFIIK